MTIQLVFIRHGIAEDRSPDLIDFNRKLTKKGKQRLRETLSNLVPLLKRDQDRFIWSSPFVRARETAEIAADIFQVEQVSTYDFISEGELTGFWSAAAKLNPSTDHTIIVVGHEPILGYWSDALCGAFLAFKKGAAAGFLIENSHSEAAELQWFFQPEGMEMLSVKSNASKILKDIRESLLSISHQVMSERASFLADPHNEETAHQLRVSIRKLRSLLAFLKPFLKDVQYDAAQGSLKTLVTKFSYLRELDVLREACMTFSKSHPGAMVADSAIFGILQQEREHETGRVVEAVSKADCGDSLCEVERELQGIAWKKNIDEDQSISIRINKLFADLYEAFENAVHAVDYKDAAATHALRIEAKKLRYVLNSLEPLTESKYGIIGTELTSAQVKLGEICDARRNKDILLKFDKQDLPEMVHTEIRAFLDDQERFASERLGFLKR